MTTHHTAKNRFLKFGKSFVQVLAIAVFALVSFISIVHGQNANARNASGALTKTPAGLPTNPEPQRRVSEFTCSLSAFMSVDSDEIVGRQAHFEGRGLATCANDHGFSTEVPVIAEVDTEVPKSMLGRGEISLSANSSTFVIERDINQLQDLYNVRPALSAVALSNSGNLEQPTLLLRGQRHDLIIEVKLKSATSQLSGLHVNHLQLRMDEAAPDLF